MLMEFPDMIMESIDGDTMFVLCNFSGITREWPKILDLFDRWQFVSQEFMTLDHAAFYAGRARYVKIK